MLSKLDKKTTKKVHPHLATFCRNNVLIMFQIIPLQISMYIYLLIGRLADA